jgi:hypothetical protein
MFHPDVRPGFDPAMNVSDAMLSSIPGHGVRGIELHRMAV